MNRAKIQAVKYQGPVKTLRALTFLFLALGCTVCLSSEPSRAGKPQARNASTQSLSIGQRSGPVSSVPAETLLAELEEATAAGNREKARESLDRILELSELDPGVLLRAGISLAQAESYADAARAFARCTQDHPAMFECSYNLALANFALGKFPDGLQVLDAAPVGSPIERVARQYLRGKTLEAMGRFAEAESELEAAFSAAPREENYALDLGLFHLRQRAYPRAIEVFERGVRYHSTSPFFGLGLALAQYLAGHAAESVKTCRSLLDRHPGFSGASLLMAFALSFDGQFAEAERIAAAGLREPNPNPFLYYLHATALLKLQSKEYDQILREYAVAARQIPGCTLCYLSASKVHQTQENYQAAIADLETAVRMDPDFPEAWYRLSHAYEHEGRRDDASRARARFRELKAEKSDQENEMIRNVFLQTLSGTSTGDSH